MACVDGIVVLVDREFHATDAHIKLFADCFVLVLDRYGYFAVLFFGLNDCPLCVQTNVTWSSRLLPIPLAVILGFDERAKATSRTMRMALGIILFP